LNRVADDGVRDLVRTCREQRRVPLRPKVFEFGLGVLDRDAQLGDPTRVLLVGDRRTRAG
jgi:hypothetical protein